MVSKIWNAVKGQRGFTLLEMATVSAILAALAAIVAVAVTGTTSSARASTKDGDMKNVDTAVARYESDNTAFPIVQSSQPIVAVAGKGSFDVISIVVDTGATNFSGTARTGTATGEVLCSTTATSTGSLASALASCFGSIDFAKLVPTYMTSAPQHDTDDVAESGDTELRYDDDAGTSDASFVNCTLNGETCNFYFLDAGGVTAVGSMPGTLPNTSVPIFTVPNAALKVWNVDKNNGPVVFKGNTDYGK